MVREISATIVLGLIVVFFTLGQASHYFSLKSAEKFSSIAGDINSPVGSTLGV